jgi:hypothetical protein
VAISMMGGIGMMSAGLIGSPGLGYFKDRFAGEELKRVDPALFEQYASKTPSRFLFFREVQGLDGEKLGQVQEAVRKGQTLSEEQKKVQAASIHGDRWTLVVDSAIPALMALIYLGLLAYFRAIGGYRAIHLDAGPPGEHEEHKLAAGYEAPVP